MAFAKSQPEIEKYLQGTIVKVIYVPDKLLRHRYQMISGLLWDLLWVLFVLFKAPGLAWQALRSNKKFPSLRERFGVFAPKGQGRGVWIHAVSVGEIKASKPLIDLLLACDPNVQILLTTATTTGREEAMRLFAKTCQIRYLPLDFSWIMRKWIRNFSPQTLLFIEGDLWPNLLSQAKKRGVKTALVSGKISERSARRFSYLPFVSKRLFGALDPICAQNEEHKARLALCTNHPIYVGGNLKLDFKPSPIDPEPLRRRFALSSKTIAIASTHAPEEIELLKQLRPLWKLYPDLVIFLAPRHPERFEEAAKAIQSLGLSFCRWQETRSSQPIVLVDAMGQLPLCYALSDLAIVAGSFSSKVGGHNVLEPCFFGCPALFGPHMQTQVEFSTLIKEHEAGFQLTSPALFSTICACFSNLENLRKNASKAALSCPQTAFKTLSLLQKHKLFSSEKEKDLGINHLSC